MMDNHIINRDLLCSMGVSCSIVLLIVSVMIFSPYAYQYRYRDMVQVAIDGQGMTVLMYDEKCPDRSRSHTLDEVNQAIATYDKDLPSIPYFDRFFSREKAMRFAMERAEIYDLKWERIVLLWKSEQYEQLRHDLEEYVQLVGYNQQSAIQALKMLNENQ